MNERPLVFITTRLPPATCGIGNYSWILREHWPGERRPIEFLVVDNADDKRTTPLGDRITTSANTRTQLARELDRVGAADVFLHYAGRAFQRFGFPFWMVAALREWKRNFPNGRLVVYFHELPGEFPIASRHHWLSKLSSAVAARIGRLADVLITNSEHHAAKLRALAGRADIHLIPIGATV
ncbi:MAG TPA: hypothetical protein VF551_07840, partial [Chthoniobacterales bacterium]